MLVKISRRVLLVVAVALVAAIRTAFATAFVIDLGRSPHVTSQVTASFDGLNGTSLLGQTLSLDLTWAKGDFGRLFTITAPSFDAAITLQTNSSGLLGLLEGTGFLIDANGHAIPGWGITGSASGDDGSMSLGLFPLFKDQNGTPNDDLKRPLDFYGVHYDLTLPVSNASILITGGQFGLFSNPGQVFGIGPGVPRDIVPETGSTLALLTLTLTGLIGLRYFRNLARLPS